MLITSTAVTDYVAMTAARGGLSVYTYYINTIMCTKRTKHHTFFMGHQYYDY